MDMSPKIFWKWMHESEESVADNDANENKIWIVSALLLALQNVCEDKYHPAKTTLRSRGLNNGKDNIAKIVQSSSLLLPEQVS